MPDSVTLKQSIQNKHFEDFISHLIIHKTNKQAREGLKLILRMLEEHKIFRHLKVYKLRHSENSIGIGFERSNTLFSVRKRAQSFSFKLNGNKDENITEWNKVARENGLRHIHFLFGISINKLSPVTEKTETRLMRYLTVVLLVPYVREFLNLSINEPKSRKNSLMDGKRGQELEEDAPVGPDDDLDENEWDDDEHEQCTFTSQRSPQKQKSLRKHALKLYKKCVISGCDVKQCIEAAHIDQFADCRGKRNPFKPCNVILLRRDLHRLYDLRTPLMYLKPVNDQKLKVKVVMDKVVKSYAEYANLDGRTFILPSEKTYQLLKERYLRSL